MTSEKSLIKETISREIIKQDILVEKPWFIWLLMFSFWTLLSVILAVQDILVWYESPEKFSGWAEIFINTFPYYYAWLALSPLVFFFGRKFGFGREEKNLRNAIIHIFLGILTVLIYLFITSYINTYLLNESVEIKQILYYVNKRFYTLGHFQIIAYWAILGVYISFNYYKKFRERETEAARLLLRSTQLESQLVKAQLDSLKMQLHPHFLFNTLHAISALIEDSPKRARRMIARLGELLRSTLDIAEQQTITLEKELALTRLYLDIERERFRNTLQVKIDVPPEVLDCRVPSLILQPLIENAIKHGVKGKERDAVIEVRVLKRNKRINIFVSDNGPGFPENQMNELEEGIGLSNTKARLEQLYGKEHNFRAFNSESGGATVEISIPCNREKEYESR